MVKSKFPGKPSKFTNRKLVNVSNCTISSIQENESQRAAEFICYGLSVFNETFGADDDEPAPFHGFSPFDIARSKELTRTRIAEIENEYKSRGAAFLPLDKKVQNKSLLLPESFIKSESDLKKQSANSTFKCQSISVKKKSIKTTSSAFNKTSLEFSSDNGSSVSVTSSNLTSHGGLKNLFTNPNSNSGSGSKNVNRNYLSSSFSSANNSQDKSIIGASNHNAFRKNFVLPCRSAHSARVIKPNKRFLDKDHDGLRGSYSSASSCSSSVTSSYDSSEQIINEPIKEPPPSTSCSSGIQLKKPRLVLGPVHDDPNFTWARSRDDSSTIISDVESDDASSLKTISSSSSSTSSSERPVIVNRTRKTKKLILRKPRLNIDTPPLQEPTRPKSGAIRGKIVCGVCNATRFYAFVRQARKFGIYSCESCRKFISKSIHTIDRSSVFHCSGGKGQCTVPPVLRTVIWDVKKQMINKGKKMRCKACWLKMCIRCYCMPEFLKIRLNKLLPSYMRDPVLSAKKIKKTADNKCKRRSHSIDSVKSTAKDNVEQNIKSKSLRQIRFEDRAKRKNAYVRRIRQRRNSLYGSNTMKSETNEESSVKNEDNESDVSGANKSSDYQNDDVDTAKESINKSSRGITVRKRRCKFKEKPGRRNKFKININNRKFRNHRRRRKNCSELSSSSNDSDTNEDFKKDDAQKALQKRIKIKQEQTQQELQMVSIVKSGTMKVNTSVNCFSVNKLKEESDKQLLNCKFEAAAVTRDYEVEKKILSLLSVPKSDVTNLETVDVPLVVPKKRGRRKKIPGEVKPPAETAAPVVKEEIRQKRKAALNSLANIARVTGRITESTVENQLIVARNLKKRATAIARREPVVPFQRKNDVKEIPVGVKRKRKDKIIFSNAPSVSRGSSNRSSSLVSLQGPRVKHVCRSASLVLGKQVATFNQSPVKSKTLAKETLSTEVVKSSLVPSDTSSATAEAALEQQPCTAIKSDSSVSSLPIQPSGSSLPQPPSPVLSAANVGGGRIRQPSLDVVSYKDRIDRDEVISGGKGKSKIIARTLQDLGKLNCEILDGVSGRTENISVSMDFWESYDPDEVAKTGFALIGSDTSFRVPSLCFLCGSAGVEKLIHCACCCEPYHLYCLNGGMKEIKEQSQWWRVDWVCPRCAVCNACGKGDGNRVSCNRCCKSYHIDCLPKDRISNKAHSSDRPWVCHSCLKCKSCYAKSVSKFVGNIPLCNSCFKLRQKGSFCPLCQKCYDDNDFDTKMMECGRCKSWVHAKCEGLSNEKYQVLSFLPDSVEFICRLCCDTPPAPWWLAVEAELRAGYLNVLKSLTKNRKTCELLKWSPKKQSLSGCTCNNLSPSNRNNILITTQPSLPRLDLSENFEQEQEVSSNVINPLLKDRPTTKMKGENLSNDSTCSSSCASFSLSLIKVDECLKKNSPVMQFTSSMNLNLLNENFKPNESNLVNADSVHSDSKDNKIINDSINDGDDLNVDVKSEIKTKFKLLKECSVALKDCLPNSESSASTPPSEELQVKINDGDQQLLSIPSYQNLESNKGAQFSPHATSQSDSGIGSTDDELKPSSSVDDSEIMIPSNSIVSSEGASSVSTLSSKPCCCLGFESLSKSYPSLLNIKNKVNSNSYSSLEEFHKDMQHVIDSVHDERLLQAYYQILFDVFPWFDPKCPQVFDSNDKDIESLHVDENDKTNIDKKDFEVDSHESPEYYEDASVVLKGLLGLSRSYYYYNVNYKDPRVCVLCKLVGDGLPEEEGRLLYCGHNEWVHANCALWSNEVFEEIDGSLQHVHGAISRSRLIRCVFCGKRGASVGCCYRNCPESYHYPCAREGCCVFMEDKSIYCNLHQNESKSKPLSKNSDFEITRPIYVELVELEKKKKKFIPHHQVKVMVGSLSVESLGEFIPDVSDQELSIVPCEFVCTRLYWSTVEPWRLVQYHIKTKILQSSHVYFVENEENFTVDHSLDVQKDKISDDVGCYNVKSEDIVEPLSETDASEKSEDSSEALESINAEVKLVVNSLLDNVSIVLSREEEKVEETLGVLTDAQTSADLLPPEIKDAIFEDLPHDILDGISMQDIFPKLMSYDDVIDKNDKLDSNSDNNAVEIPNNCNINSSIKYKKIKCGNNDQSYFSGVLFKKPTDSNSKLQINDNVNKSDTQSSGDMMKSSPSKLILKSSVTNLKPEAVVKTDINLRTVNKFDYNGSKDTENENLKSSSDWKSSAILQVDGATDYSSGDSDVGSPHNIVDSDDKILCKPVLHVTIQDTKQIDSANKFRNKEKLELCQIIQVDGCVDSGSEYESGNDTPKLGKDCEDDSYYFDYEQNNWRCISQLDGTSDCNNIEMSTQDAEEEPVKCMRCHRTYRTAVSYERHLSTCNADYILSCSESDSSEEEKSSSPLNGPLNSPSSVSNSESPNNHSESTESANNLSEPIESSSSSTVSAESTGTIDSSNVGNGEMSETNEVSTSLVELNSDFCQGAEDVVEYVVQTSESTDGVQESTCINSALYKDADSPGVNPDNNSYAIITSNDEQNEIEIPNGDVTVYYTPDNIDNCILINIDNDNKIVEDNSSGTTYYVTDNAGTTTGNSSSVIGTDHLKNAHILGGRNKEIINYSHTAAPIHTPQQTQQQQIVDYQGTPTLIIQQIPSQQNVMPTYVETFSQPTPSVQSQQNVHYITIDSGDKTTPQYSSVLSNAYQIQSPAPAVQTVVPTVVGTIIQPNGVEQLLLNTNPTNSMDVFGQQGAGGVYLSSPPPMYMNMETVVSNTVMSSSQFVSVPGSVPGMLSTYSATTTQVFQAAKPVIDIPSQSYLVINTSPNATATAAIVDNSNHHMNATPQATITQLHQAKQEQDQWPTFRYQHQQNPVDRPHKVNDKTTVVRQILQKDKTLNCVHQVMNSTENRSYHEPVRVTNCNKRTSSDDSDVLKIMQNAQKIGPVHHLSKLVDNIQTGSSATKKICLNSIPVKQNLPEVLLQQKINPTVQKLDSFADKFNKKVLYNTFNLPKKSSNLCYNNKLVAEDGNKKVHDSFCARNVVNNFESSPDTLVSNFEKLSSNKIAVNFEKSLPNNLMEKSPSSKSISSFEKASPNKSFDSMNSCVKSNDICTKTVSPPVQKSYLSKEADDKFDKLILSPDHRKVIVESVKTLMKDSDKAANDYTIRTYSKKKGTILVPSTFVPQMKELKSQLTKEYNKHNQKYINNNLLSDVGVDACANVGINSSGATCTNVSSNVTNISVGNNNRVLQPTLKENKILDKMKLNFNEKCINLNNNIKRSKHSDKKVAESTSSSNKKDLMKERPDKIVNGRDGKKIEKMKRKEISSSVGEDKPKKLNNTSNSLSSNNNIKVTSKKSASSPNMVFEINSEDGFSCSTPNLVDAWQKVFEAVQAARASKKLPPLPRNPYQSVNSLLKMLGLGNNSLKYMIEQLPGVSKSVNYKPTYHKNRHHSSRRECETKENLSGCARTEPFSTRNKYDMFSWLASRHRRPPKLLISSDADIINGNRRATSLNLPMAMRFRHLRETSKEAVGVFRSDIHGRGLFCLRDIDSGEMVIEYAGEVIRSALTDTREKYYTSKGIGCYMFRIDDNFVVDATMKGNAARFINHSCEPNCYSRVVDILGKKHILIFALRRIPQGEELTYDYKFPLEDDKITCHCLSRKCRKYLN